ncbi:hypothetical protein M433DRAFT_27492 [Acidomyces richmondensis BFW]|nr:MAG: hypothetical protein FE78DRAFT_179597 [Acidomyces sp. 'richmondensis']KYG41581.1 hypothetical protein M433DRAFT_27492 [Acidomyces richmondensis BFW]
MPRLKQTAAETDGKSYLELIQEADNFPFDPLEVSKYYKLFLPGDEEPHGYLLPEIVAKMPWTGDFMVDQNSKRITVHDRSHGQKTAQAVNAAFQNIVKKCIDGDTFRILCRQHSEPFLIPSAVYDQPVYVERFAAPLFGITCRGAHLIAYTYSKDHDLHLWIPRRSQHLFAYPGMLDTTVAGGVKAGVTPFQTIIQESHEEASLEAKYIERKIYAGGLVSHMSVTGKGFKGEQGLVVPDFIYVYDLELPSDTIPKPHDEEVKEFYRMPVREVQAALKAAEFKPDSAMVIIDFFIRHGIITADNEGQYVEICTRLRRRLPFRTGLPR